MTILTYLAIGLAIGSISGVLGIGGGVLLVPALIWLCGFDAKRAAGTSLAILIPPIGLPAAWRAYHQNHVDLTAALCIAAAFTVGAYVSRPLIYYIPEAWFRLIFGAVMVFIALRFMIDSDSEAASAAAGLIAALISLLGYWGLKLLGRRYLPKPDLGAHVQAQHQQIHEDRDYRI